jgi:hypothetical protein
MTRSPLPTSLLNISRAAIGEKRKKRWRKQIDKRANKRKFGVVNTTNFITAKHKISEL